MTPAQHAGTSLNQSHPCVCVCVCVCRVNVCDLHAKHLLNTSVKTSVKGKVQQILATNQCLFLICKKDQDNPIEKNSICWLGMF